MSLFQDGPIRIAATSTGTNSMISKIVRMVSNLISFGSCNTIKYDGGMCNYIELCILTFG